MVEIVIYSRAECHLCDEAKDAVNAVRGEGYPVEIREIDVDSDPELRRLYTDEVPVVFVAGKKAFKYRVDRAALIERITRATRGGGPMTLAEETCVPCRGGVPPLPEDESGALLRELDGGWRVVRNHHLEREFTFPDFRAALDFTNRVGRLAEEQGHHPDIHLSWGKVKIEIWTHKIDGLTRSDFVLAAKVDGVAK